MKKWGVIASVTLVALATLGAGLATNGSDLLRARLEAELRAALGPRAALGAIELEGATVVLRDLTLAGDALPFGSHARIERLRVHGDLRALLSGDAPPVRGLDVEGGTLELSRDALETQLRRRGAGASGTGADAPPATARVPQRLARLVDPGADVRIRDLRVAWREPGVTSTLVEDLDVEIAGPLQAPLAVDVRAVLADGAAVEARAMLSPAPFQAEGRLAVRELSLAFARELLGPLPLLGASEDARLTAELDAFELGSDALRARGKLEARNLVLEHAALHEAPVPLPAFRAEGRVHWRPADAVLELDDARVERDGVQLAGQLRWDGTHQRLALRASLPETPCDAALGVVPATLLGRFGGFAWSGRLSGALSLVADVAAPERSRLELEVDERCQFQQVPESVRLARFDAPFVHTVRGHGEVLHRFRTGPGHPHWTPLAAVSPFLIHAVLAHEDGAFLRHQGFAPWAIETALQRNLEQRRFAYGASTISMQLAKNLFLERSKRLDRKLQEALLTWWLEERLSKREILELYLNVIEYGPGLYGIRDAADHYFGRTPAELSVAESAFLASLLPAPTTRHRDHVRGGLSRAAQQRITDLLEHMHRRGRIDFEAFRTAQNELEAFRFRPEGGERPEPRGLVGEAAPLPFATAAVPRDPDPVDALELRPAVAMPARSAWYEAGAALRVP